MNIDNRISRFNTDMNRDGTVAGNTLLQNLDIYFVELKLANATNLARSGHYTRAETLVSVILGDHGETSAILDLQARIYAQQGRLGEAETTWRKALLLDPSNSAYQEALHRISKTQRRPIWWIPLFYLLISLSLIFALVAGTTILVNRVRMSSLPQSSYMLQNKNLENELVDKLTTLENSIQSLKSGSGSMLPPTLHLGISGISTRVEGNELIVVFKEGLFEKGAVLYPEAKTLITDLGKQLEPYIGRIHIKIYGITDDIPMPEGQKYNDNIDLGKARASAVYDHLRETTKLTSDRLLIGSFGEYLPPYPNKSLEGRAKNRAVVIRISHFN